MAYATVANMRVQFGLYTCILPLVVYAFIGGSRTASVTTTSTIATLTASTMVGAGIAAGSAEAQSVQRHHKAQVMRLLLSKISGDIDALELIAAELGDNPHAWRNVTKSLLKLAAAGWVRDDDTEQLVDGSCQHLAAYLHTFDHEGIGSARPNGEPK